MSELQINAGEILIDSGMVVYWEPRGLFNYSTWDGYIYITDQRVIFQPIVSGIFTLEFPVSELIEFWTSKHFFIPAVTICNKNAETFRFSGFKTKKLVDWLEQQGVPKSGKRKAKKRGTNTSGKKGSAVLSKLGNAAGVLFILWMVMGGIPTGWLYDLGVGAGTEQGQKPGPGVQTIESKEEAREFFYEEDPVPATVAGTVFVRCPLMRLRDTSAEGDYQNWNSISRTRHNFRIDGYQELDYPITPVQKVLTFLLAGASYNSYYLVQLDDGSYLCVFFDDYLMLQKVLGGEVELPVGYVRGSTRTEYVMLYEMAKDYDVDFTLVLDMYRDGKGFWLLDKGLRLMFAVVIVVCIESMLDKRKEKMQDRR